MEEEILDSPHKEKSTEYAKESFKYFLYSIGLLIFSTLGSILQTNSGTTNELLTLLFGLPVLLIFVTSFIGLRGAILSFKNKESSQLKKYVGLIGNMLFLILFLSLIIANIIDFTNFVN